MKTVFRLLLVALTFALFFSLTARAADECGSAVKTETGLVSGAADPELSVCAWKGIPYAAPPVGDLRFRSPRPAAGWSGVRAATAYGHECVQTPKGKDMAEDCLYLNVWRPKKSGTFPVMVWIHGGGYVMGSGGSGLGGKTTYDGAALSNFGEVVVVTINYRLNIFGFLADPALRKEDENQSAGNYGSLDQVAALKWVHENIAGFGGDPGNVTIFGESAGGWSICTMLATPLNKGLFHRAILESGGCGKSEDLEVGYAKSKPIENLAGCEQGDLPCLRKVPAEKLRRAIQLRKNGMMWGPHHDGYLLSATPLAMIRAGNYNQVPFMAGFNKNEVDATVFFLPQLWYAPPREYQARLVSYLGVPESEAKLLVSLYPLASYGNQPRQGYGAMFTDAGLACPTFLGALAAAGRQEAVYLYRFDYDDYKYGKHLGALHGMEVPFVFGSVRPGKLYAEKTIGPARELMKTIQSYWTNFAKTGDPNGNGLPAWPRFSIRDQKLQVLDTSVRTEPAGMIERCDFWEPYLKDHRMEESLGRKPKP